MQPRSLRAEAHRIWQHNRKMLMKQFGDSQEKMALAEILALRQLALAALSAQTMASLSAPGTATNKKFTR